MAERTTPVSPGETAPDFTLKDQRGQDFNLAGQRGKRVLLSFHPLAWTGVCAKQMQNLEARKSDFDSLNTVAVGISVDSVPTKQAWAKDLGIKETRVLADFWPHGQVAKLYGLFREKEGFSQRANVIVDEQGKVAFVKVYEISQLPDLDEVIGELKKSREES
ncbi:MAG: redoxin domain-containing protein [Dehalococcoidales bacterium]|nr:redoxin domain-containing protein [Dehalococcoidales bacterium]